ncbi:MtrAB system histidine kinase MtrB [Falsarthrobacter nasiphocae]|uniref:Sensor histidine kinase MtrB n=1 Tax=Falsarthrobacter nasiphocae TaxID=189863 RepID=A0AAE4C5T9_9MICC|nr:MtrAB system histidine kinase MtrB [Falsarthrobacter nasiphocae]MDR6891427.1 two-component system sensor histidine kinase MtrB [Falsarthrobacter nasiphocae]
MPTTPPAETPRRALQSWWSRSLQFRTIVSTILLCAIAFIGIGAYLSHQIANALYEERVRQYQAEASSSLTQVAAQLRQSKANDRTSTAAQADDSLQSLQRTTSDPGRAYVLSPFPAPNIWVQTRSTISPSVIPEALATKVHEGNAQYSEATTIIQDGRPVPAIAFGQKVKLPPNNDYALYLVYSMESIQKTLDVIHRVLWGAGALMIGVVGVIAWIVTKSVVGPISQAAAVSERLAAGDLQERIQVRGDDEIARLGSSFNNMAATLQSQITELATLSQMQQSFVSDVSHELRTPLTTVRMAAEVLYGAKDEFDPINRRSAELLYNQVERFDVLLADLLEISRYDAGVAVLDPEPTDLTALIGRVIDITRPLAEDAGCEITVEALATDPVVDVDPRRIERVVRNFIVNAIEHGAGEPIEVVLAEGPETIAIAVRDHGIGMTADESRRVFDRFWRADPARARKTGGSGLGLSIAEEDARLHGGWLAAWGRPQEGSAFLLVLPRVPGGSAEVSPLGLPPGSDRVVRRPLDPAETPAETEQKG